MSAVTIHTILAQFREEATSNRDLGDRFERLIARYLELDPLYAERFSRVWMWNEFPLKGHVGDVGIDLVAQERATGEYCAIQCKFYLPDHTLAKEDIDSFFTAAGKAQFTSCMIVSTTDKWGKNAEQALSNQSKPVTRLRVQDLDQSPVDWSKFSLTRPQALGLRPRKTLREHQTAALENVVAGFATHDRGKLIMACGSGKTFTALKIAERLAPHGHVLFLVPSLSLLSQSLREWTAETALPLHSLAVCSDSNIGKKHTKGDDDSADITTHDLAFPATTSAREILRQYEGIRTLAAKSEKPGLTVVFSTYQSLAAVSQAQKSGLPAFDLVICDEAHRTTGVTLSGDDESQFVKVHDAAFLAGKKRLYMTATPRIYSDDTKVKAKDSEAELCSMDDESKFGPEFHRLGFGEAVAKGLLSDYKVLVLAVDEKYVSKTFQRQIADSNNELKLEDAVKITGCWNGLAKRMDLASSASSDLQGDTAPMTRAVAFSRSIKDSKAFVQKFAQIIEVYRETHPEAENLLHCELDHVDGTFHALRRNSLLDWLKEPAPAHTCRILSNARCLSEGVDVPALDAVLFLNPRNSVVDVVQSVGRVMRRAEGKKYGYIILPVGIPADMSPDEALKDNEKYKVVWQVLQALRAHDDRFNATVNQIELNKKRPDVIQVIGVGGGPADGEVGEGTAKPIQHTFDFPQLDEWKDAIYARIVQKCGDRRYWESWAKDVAGIAERHTDRIKLLLENGSPRHKAAFAAFLAGLHQNINPSITEDDAIEMLSQHLITRPVFDALFEGYAFTQNNPVSKAMQAMLDALSDQALEKETAALEAFYASVRQRATGIDNAEGRQRIVIELYDKFFRTAFPKMAERLGIVYTPVEVVDFIIHSVNDALQTEFKCSLTDEDVHVIDPFTGTGTFLVRLLQSGFIEPKDLVRKYTKELHANEIVLLAYYIAAINIEETFHSLQRQRAAVSYGKGPKGRATEAVGRPYRAQSQVVTDPRALPWAGMDRTLGAGTKADASSHSETGSLPVAAPTTSTTGKLPVPPSPAHDNSATGTGAACSGMPLPAPKGHAKPAQGNALGSSPRKSQSPEGAAYLPFEGIVLTDTFQMSETKGELEEKMFPENNHRISRQKRSPIRVVIGNPPYSVGQGNANNNNQNLKYPSLDERIRATYAERSTATNKNSLYDSYIHALRWASDRLGEKGIIGFVTNGSFVDSNTMAGLRACLIEEFSTIYIFNLRGNQRTSGETSRMEGGKIFGSGSRTQVAISLFIKNPDKKGKCELHYHDIGDYLDREEKLSIIKKFQGILPMHYQGKWQRIQPNSDHDWINQRDPAFERFLALDGDPLAVFSGRSNGVQTNRDDWAYNYSKTQLGSNMRRMIEFYNEQVLLHGQACSQAGDKAEQEAAKRIDTDSKRIKWTRGLIANLCRKRPGTFSISKIGLGVYRPFSVSWVYYDRQFNEYFKEKIYPSVGFKNQMIAVTGAGESGDFSCLVVDRLPNLHTISAGQCFPLYLYEKDEPQEGELISHEQEGELVDGYRRRSAITDAILVDFHAAYSQKVTKEDIFYYVYGMLHSPEYKSRFSSDLKKMLPRLPLTRETADFWKFSQAGRDLAHWHLHYETIEPYPLAEHTNELTLDPAKHFLVTKMNFARPSPAQKAAGEKFDKTVIHYNAHVTLSGIPLETYDYIVNGKSALDWVMERYQITVDKDSGLRNDPNDWSREHGQPRYILDLVKRVVRVSLETMKIVNTLPALNERK